MKKYQIISTAISISLFLGCTSTTDKESDGNQSNRAPDSAAGNTNAANTIYRDSTNILNGTQAGGGTGNPSASADSSNKVTNIHH